MRYFNDEGERQGFFHGCRGELRRMLGDILLIIAVAVVAVIVWRIKGCAAE